MRQSDFQFNLTGIMSLEIRAHVNEASKAFRNGERFSTLIGTLELQLEPKNPYDEYAIRVIADKQYTIGYVPKHICDECGNPLTPMIIKQGECANTDCKTKIPADIEGKQFNKQLGEKLSDYNFHVVWLGDGERTGVILEARPIPKTESNDGIKWG